MKKLSFLFAALLLFMLTAQAAVAAPTIMLDGHQLKSEVPPIVKNGRTMVPLRLVSESLGASVMWQNNEASIKTPAGDKLRFYPKKKPPCLRGQTAAAGRLSWILPPLCRKTACWCRFG